MSCNIMSCNIVSCNICYEDLDPARNQCITECGHQFCFRCIMATISSSIVNYNLCPICRTQMLSYVPPDHYTDGVAEEPYLDETTVAAYHTSPSDKRVAPICQIVRRIQDEGFDMGDLVSLLLNRYELNGKYNHDYVEDSRRFLTDILHSEDIYAVQTETTFESKETEQMGAEDVAATRIEIRDRHNKVFSSLYETIERSLMIHEELRATEYEHYSNTVSRNLRNTNV